MANWLEHIVEPKKLILAWQAPDAAGDRYRWAVGQVYENNGHVELQYFADDAEFCSVNQGKSFSALHSLGYRGYPAFPIKQKRHRNNILSTLMRRLPPRSRDDFENYTAHIGIRHGAEISDFALLGRTEARLPNDGFSLVDPLIDATLPCDLFIQVAGYRYHAAGIVPSLKVGDSITFREENDNRHDPNAVEVMTRGGKVGYINRLQTGALHRWLKADRVVASVERMNGTPERPRVLIFVRVRSQLQDVDFLASANAP